MTATVELCELDELAPGLGRPFTVGDLELAVFRGRAGEVYAVDGFCPHKRGPLADGMLIGSHVVCPLHFSRFHGGSGECEEGAIKTCHIKGYPVELRGQTVAVIVPVGQS